MESRSPHLIDRLLARRRSVSAALAMLVGLCLVAVQGGQWLDLELRTIRDGIRAHPASGEIHIVEIDARSLAELDRWPWPRHHHAEAIDRLTADGARTIGFDVDFSSSSSAIEDAALATALERAGGGVILPTIHQWAGAGRSGFVDTLPIKAFRDNAFVAAVTVVPDQDGRIRTMPLGIVTDGSPRPSLAAMLAERPAQSGGFFGVDFSIDPQTIPRHSFVDLISGRIAPGTFQGKRVLVGATAVELGDRYAVPRFGVIPGVVVQALAAETLLQGPIPASGSSLLALLVAIGSILLAARSRAGRATRMLYISGGTLAVLAMPLVAEEVFAVSLPIAPALAALLVASLATIGLHFACRFRERAVKDVSTGLPNAAALEDDLAAEPGAMLVIARIDRYADIAAGLGPEASVTLIHRLADRLVLAHGNRVYRAEHDALAWFEDRSQAESLFPRLQALSLLMRSAVDCGRPVDVKLCFGIAEASPAGPRHQIANAALAAAHAARNGNRWELHREEGDSDAQWQLSLVSELDAAIAAGQVWNAYQPKLDLRTGRVVGAEALVRWDHPVRGSIPPGDFIPLLEQHGRISDLTVHVLQTALRDALAWTRAGTDLGVAINISAILLSDEEFVALVEDLIGTVGLGPEWITLEVTETAALRDPGTAIAALARWRALGMQISIDDYGTGQSSLGYLQQLPATELKIDMSFVTNLATQPRNSIVVRSTIAMAHELGLKVVAEGVEDAACLELLRQMGCDIAQGWHIGHAVAAEHLQDLALEARLVA